MTGIRTIQINVTTPSPYPPSVKPPFSSCKTEGRGIIGLLSLFIKNSPTDDGHYNMFSSSPTTRETASSASDPSRAGGLLRTDLPARSPPVVAGRKSFGAAETPYKGPVRLFLDPDLAPCLDTLQRTVSAGVRPPARIRERVANNTTRTPSTADRDAEAGDNRAASLLEKRHNNPS